MPPIRIHDIRHTVATVAIAAGLNPKAVSEHLGHAKTAITLDIYTKVVAAQQADVARRISAAMIKSEKDAATEEHSEAYEGNSARSPSARRMDRRGSRHRKWQRNGRESEQPDGATE